MRLFRYTVIAGVLALAFAMSASAGDNDKVFKLTSPDSLNTMLKEYIDETTSKDFVDPRIPRFIISDRSDKFFFGVGGYVGAKLFGDWNGNRNDGFSTSYFVNESFDNAVLDLDLSSTTLLFKIIGQTEAGFIDANIEADFSGVNRQMKLSKAYLSFRGFRIGLAPTVFHDREMISLIDGDQSFSKTKRSIPMVGYMHRFDKFRVMGSLEFPQTVTATVDGELVQVSSPFSDFVVGSDYNADRFHAYAGAQARVLQYTAPIDSDIYRYKVGCSFQLSGNYKVVNTPSMTQTAFLQTVWSTGMEDCMLNLRNRGLNLILPANTEGSVDPIMPSAVGAQLGYQVVWGANSINFTASGDIVYGHETAGYDSLHKSGYAASLNYIRSIMKYATVGTEAIYGANHALGGAYEKNWRVYIYFRYDF